MRWAMAKGWLGFGGSEFVERSYVAEGLYY